MIGEKITLGLASTRAGKVTDCSTGAAGMVNVCSIATCVGTGFSIGAGVATGFSIGAGVATGYSTGAALASGILNLTSIAFATSNCTVEEMELAKKLPIGLGAEGDGLRWFWAWGVGLTAVLISGVALTSETFLTGAALTYGDFWAGAAFTSGTAITYSTLIV